MFYILQNREVVPATLKEWVKWFHENHIQVNFSELPGNIRISTTFIGLSSDFGCFGSTVPLVFETMIFGGPYHLTRWCYCTYAQAEEGHKKAVELCFSNVFSKS